MALIDPSPLTKLHTKIEQNEKVCCAQAIDSYTQGQGHNHVRGQIMPNCVAHKLLKQI